MSSRWKNAFFTHVFLWDSENSNLPQNYSPAWQCWPLKRVDIWFLVKLPVLLFSVRFLFVSSRLSFGQLDLVQKATWVRSSESREPVSWVCHKDSWCWGAQVSWWHPSPWCSLISSNGLIVAERVLKDDHLSTITRGTPG